MTRAGYIRLTLFLIVLFTGIGIAYRLNLDARSLPVYNPADLNPALVDASIQKVTKDHRVAPFTLVNQQGRTVTEHAVEGKIYVADFFFTTCQTICPKMTGQMQRVYQEFAGDTEVMLLSHTVHPENDSVPVLAAYAKQHGIDASRWHLLTGEKKQIYELARQSYFAVTSTGTGDADDFIHTENFVLVDKDKRLRGFYDGTSPDDVNRLIEDIYILKNEYRKKE